MSLDSELAAVGARRMTAPAGEDELLMWALDPPSGQRALVNRPTDREVLVNRAGEGCYAVRVRLGDHGHEAVYVPAAQVPAVAALAAGAAVPDGAWPWLAVHEDVTVRRMVAGRADAPDAARSVAALSL